MASYIDSVVSDKRARPDTDILTSLIDAEVAGDRLSRQELVAQVMLLYMAGYENGLNLVGNGLVHLFEFPDQLDRMRTDASLDANAIEEIIRFDSPIQFTRRVCAEPLEIGGVTAPAGSLLFLALGAANRDPEQWGDSADVLDLARPSGERARLLRGRTPPLPGLLPRPTRGEGGAAAAGEAVSPHGAGLRRACVGGPHDRPGRGETAGTAAQLTAVQD